MEQLLGFMALIVGPPVLGVIVGLLQLLVYRCVTACGMIRSDQVPPFLILWLRGLVVVVAAAAALGIWSAAARGTTGS